MEIPTPPCYLLKRESYHDLEEEDIESQHKDYDYVKMKVGPFQIELIYGEMITRREAVIHGVLPFPVWKLLSVKMDGDAQGWFKMLFPHDWLRFRYGEEIYGTKACRLAAFIPPFLMISPEECDRLGWARTLKEAAYYTKEAAKPLESLLRLHEPHVWSPPA